MTTQLQTTGTAFTPLLLARLVAASIAGIVLLMGDASAASLREAFESAWAAQNQAKVARDDAFAAQRQAGQAWTPEPPSLAVAHATDRFNGNGGRRDWEAEISVPLWLPGQRGRAVTLSEAEAAAWSARFISEKWKLAGDLRNIWWESRIASVEHDLALRKLDEAGKLEKDVARRVKAGDLPPLELNLALLNASQARLDVAKTKLAAERAYKQFQAISNQRDLPDVDESLAAFDASQFTKHPLIASLDANAVSADARLKQVSGDTRNAPELALGLINERDAVGANAQRRIRVGLKIPFGTQSRNQPRITAANADLIEAQVIREQESRKVVALIEAARLELEQSREAVALSAERQQLAQQNAEWIAKAFRMGQTDLTTLIRIDTERFSADLTLAKARLEAGRAVSRFNQAAGVLP